MTRVLSYTVPADFDGKKLLSFLRGGIRLSLRQMRHLKTLEDGLMLNGQPVRTIDLVHTGDTVTLRLPIQGDAVEPVEMPLDILFEDEDLLVINKPAGLAMHPTHNHQGDTLANGVAWYLQKKGVSCPQRAVGRLDKGTGGVVLCALNAFAAAKLSGKPQKEYYAVADAVLSGSGTIDVPIYRPDPMKTLRACGDVPGAERAVTHWTALETDGVRTLVSVRPETGRTHQIRVHFASIGAPLTGDPLYGDPGEIGHQLLFCREVVLPHPVTEERMVFTAPLPPEFTQWKQV